MDNTKTVATRDALLARRELARREVPCPELGPGTIILVRELTGAERDAYDKSLWKQTKSDAKLDLDHATAKLVAMSIIDEDGNKILDESDVIVLSTRCGARMLKRIADACKELSGITAEEIEDLTKN